MDCDWPLNLLWTTSEWIVNGSAWVPTKVWISSQRFQLESRMNSDWASDELWTNSHWVVNEFWKNYEWVSTGSERVLNKLWMSLEQVLNEIWMNSEWALSDCCTTYDLLLEWTLTEVRLNSERILNSLWLSAKQVFNRTWILNAATQDFQLSCQCALPGYCYNRVITSTLAKRPIYCSL